MPVPVVRWLARAVCFLFYRADTAGNVPPAGPVLLLANHPNALLDPAVVWATAGRDVRFLAKSTLFSGPFAAVLKAAGAIPVYRRLDQGVDTSRNSETFAAVERALLEGEAVCIFPEGISHSASRLAPLRTGAARMTIAAERRGAAVQLVATGLNFDRKSAFRSRVTVLYGRPFSARDLVSQKDADSATVRLLTERIAQEMRRLVVESERDEDVATIERVERLYAAARGAPADAQERIARRQAIAEGVERLRAQDTARFSELAHRLRRYDQRLRRFGFRDAHLDWDLSARAALSFLIREGIAALLLLPLAAAGFIIFWAPYQVTGMLSRRATDQREAAATATVFVGAGTYTAWLALLVATAWLTWGVTAAVLTGLLLPAVAIAGLFAVERETAVAGAVRSWLLLKRAKQRSRTRLQQERSGIADLLAQAYEWISAERPGHAGGQTRH
jgi:glycerol-3-phosphate O-acyltransferase/dihydroxyacetone phosphate acyltransferase